MFKSKSQGFTLIELLIVITILAVLMGVLIIVIKPAELINRARTSAVKTYVAKACSAVQICNVNDTIDGRCDAPVTAMGTAPNSNITIGTTSTYATVDATTTLVSASSATCNIACDTSTGAFTVGADCVQ